MILKNKVKQLRSVMLMTALMVSTNGYATTATSDFQSWIPVNINVKLTEQLRGFLELQPRVGNDHSHLTSMIIRPALGWAVSPQATLWVGYLMQADSTSPSSNHYLIENRAFQGFTWRDTANEKQFIWDVRNRLEERFLPSNSDPSIRWRTRVRVEQLIPNHTDWSVIASEEIFVNLNDNANNVQLQAGAQQNRAYLGFGYRFAPEFQVETGFLYQHVWKKDPAGDQNNKIWMTNFNLNF
ncbi:MAG: DUF2490 domain-containing protein [Methylococcales bacterium]|nr:DUF2490 domain-containing protein [Methylococcales bacterium]